MSAVPSTECIILACGENKTDKARCVLSIKNAAWTTREPHGANGDVCCYAGASEAKLVFTPALEGYIEFYRKIRNDVNLPRKVVGPQRCMFVDRHQHRRYKAFFNRKNCHERFFTEATKLLEVAEP